MDNLPFYYDRNAAWVKIVEKELACVTKEDNFNITKLDVSLHLRKIPNWKASDPD